MLKAHPFQKNFFHTNLMTCLPNVSFPRSVSFRTLRHTPHGVFMITGKLCLELLLSVVSCFYFIKGIFHSVSKKLSFLYFFLFLFNNLSNIFFKTFSNQLYVIFFARLFVHLLCLGFAFFAAALQTMPFFFLTNIKRNRYSVCFNPLQIILQIKNIIF